MPVGFADYSLDQSGILGVVNGGTGAGALTQNGVLLGNGGGPIISTAAGTPRQVLAVPAAGGPPQFQNPDFNTVTLTPVLSSSVTFPPDTVGFMPGGLLVLPAGVLLDLSASSGLTCMAIQ